MNEGMLKNFIVNSKKHTYPSGDGKTLSRIPASKEFHFKENNLEYVDIYFGNISFNGIETVYEDGRPVWGMVYSGGIVNDETDTGGLYSFLKKCLLLVDEEAPFRGPESYSEGDYTYYNDFDGDFSHFIGYEKIEIMDETSYELHYSGGYIT